MGTDELDGAGIAGKTVVRAELDGMDVFIFRENDGTFVDATVVGGDVVHVAAFKDGRDAIGFLHDAMVGAVGVDGEDWLRSKRIGKDEGVVVARRRVEGSDRVVWVAAHAICSDVSLRAFDSRRDAMLCAACFAMRCAPCDVITVGDDVFRIFKADDRSYGLCMAIGWLSDGDGRADIEMLDTSRTPLWTVGDALKLIWDARSGK